jgi:hypothetical protein
MTSYNFSKTTDFTSGTIILSELQNDVNISSISSAILSYINEVGDTITFFFSGALSGPDQTTLSNICTNYANDPRPLATSSLTGDLVVSGGIGVGANMWLGSAFSNTNITTAGSVFNIPAFTYTSTTGSPTNVNIASINQVTIAETNAATTIANAASFYIANAPLAGTNVSAITNSYALQIVAGKTYIGGALQIPTGATNGYVLSCDGSGNTVWISPSAASFTGFVDGTAALPGAYFTNQPGTGFFRPASGQIGVELAGANYATFTTTGLNLVTGSTLNVGSSGTTSPLNVYGLITGSNGLTISAGATTLQTTTLASSSTSAAVIMSGGLAVAKNIWVGASFTDAIYTSNSTKGILLNIPAITTTDNALAAGTTSNINTLALGQTTLTTAANTITATDAASLYIAGPPIAGTRVTITNPYALQIVSGKTLLGGGFQISTGATNGFALISDTTGNGTWQNPALNVYVLQQYQVIENSSSFTITSTTAPGAQVGGLTLTIIEPGTYSIFFTCLYNSPANGRTTNFNLVKNGTLITNTRLSATATGSTGGLQGSINATVTCAANDVIAAYAYMSATTALIPNYRAITATRIGV